jgi:hypothetical protein
MPLTIPFTSSSPKGPASKVFGAAGLSGPVIEGVGSGVEVEAWFGCPAGVAWPGTCVAGVVEVSCAIHTEVNPKHTQMTVKYFKARIRKFPLQDGSNEKKKQEGKMDQRNPAEAVLRKC